MISLPSDMIARLLAQQAALQVVAPYPPAPVPSTLHSACIALSVCSLCCTSAPRMPLLRARHHLPMRRMRRTMPLEAAPLGAMMVTFFLERLVPEPSSPDAAGSRSRRACGAARRWLAWIGMTWRLKRARTVQCCRARVDMRAPGVTSRVVVLVLVSRMRHVVCIASTSSRCYRMCVDNACANWQSRLHYRDDNFNTKRQFTAVVFERR